MNPLVSSTRPLVVSQRTSSTFKQQRAKQSRTTLGNPPSTVCLTRLILFGDRASVSRNLASVFESFCIINRLSGNSANAVDLHHSLDTFVLFGDQVQLLFDALKEKRDLIKCGQVLIEFASPEFFQSNNGFSESTDSGDRMCHLQPPVKIVQVVINFTDRLFKLSALARVNVRDFTQYKRNSRKHKCLPVAWVKKIQVSIIKGAVIVHWRLKLPHCYSSFAPGKNCEVFFC